MAPAKRYSHPTRALTLLALSLLASGPALSQPAQYPATPKKTVSDTFFGTRVSEDHRWLEDGKDSAVRAWSLEQAKLTRGYLDALPMRPKLRKRFNEIHSTAAVRYSHFRQAGAFFAMKRQPPKNQQMLVMMKSAGDIASERVLYDPNQADASGHRTIDWFVPSLDGRHVAVSLSEKGSEDGSAHVIDTSTGKMLPDVVPRVQYPTGGGSLAWDARGTGLYYTRYPQGAERAKGGRCCCA